MWTQGAKAQSMSLFNGFGLGVKGIDANGHLMVHGVHSAWWGGSTGVWVFDYNAQSDNFATGANGHYRREDSSESIADLYGPTADSHWYMRE